MGVASDAGGGGVASGNGATATLPDAAAVVVAGSAAAGTAAGRAGGRVLVSLSGEASDDGSACRVVPSAVASNARGMGPCKCGGNFSLAMHAAHANQEVGFVPSTGVPVSASATQAGNDRRRADALVRGVWHTMHAKQAECTTVPAAGTIDEGSKSVAPPGLRRNRSRTKGRRKKQEAAATIKQNSECRSGKPTPGEKKKPQRRCVLVVAEA